MSGSGEAPLGVAIVAFNSSDVIVGCLDSLFASQGAELRVAVTDNFSGDDTVELVRRWARDRAAREPGFSFAELPADTSEASTAQLTLLRSAFNGGYAHGVNAALKLLLRDPALDLFWVLNPDCEVEPDVAARYLAAGADGNFSLMCGRTVYKDMPDRIQTDGGRLNRWTGVCSPANIGLPPATTPLPAVSDLDFIPGSNAVASRRFIERAGLMTEDYFLYYEEVDWAFRRGDLPFRMVEDAVVHHFGGTSIGSGSMVRRATPFANYFNYRNRIRFLRRHRPIAVPVACAWAAAKALQLTLKGGVTEAWAILSGTFGLAPPRAVRERIGPGDARRLAFGDRA